MRRTSTLSDRWRPSELEKERYDALQQTANELHELLVEVQEAAVDRLRAEITANLKARRAVIR